MRADDLVKRGEQLFGKRSALMSFWQELAENFYPERADFTTEVTYGSDFMDGLTTSYPVLVRRDLGNAFGSMLRPTSKSWYHIRTTNYDLLSNESRAWLERAAGIMRRHMYRPSTQFIRAMKEGDHDYATFGQAVTSVEKNSTGDALLYRTWPLRDVAWCENVEGEIDTVFRRWKLTSRQMFRLFGERVHQTVKSAVEREPFKEFVCWHVVMPSEDYGRKSKFKYTSVYIDPENRTILEEVDVPMIKYNIPRWQTISGSQYAFSPATTVALPDARLLQAMSMLLLDAGEKAVTPPMVAVKEALRSDLNVYAGGVTWVSAEYDERLGEVLRPLTQDRNGVPLGLDMQQDTRTMLREAFYLSKLSLPQPETEMTAYEVGQRVQEYIRQALPLFEPTEQQVNGGICERTFDLLLRNNAFGPLSDIPTELRGAEVVFQFESPLHDALDREKGQRLLETRDMLGIVAELDPTSVAMLDAKVALRDALNGIGVPAKWLRSESDVARVEAEMAARQEQLKQQQDLMAAAETAKSGAQAARAMR